MAKKVVLFTANYVPHTVLISTLLLASLLIPTTTLFSTYFTHKKAEAQRTQPQNSWQLQIN